MSVSHLEPFSWLDFGVHEELNGECCNGCTQPNGDKKEQPTSVFECDNLFFPFFYVGLLNIMPFVHRRVERDIEEQTGSSSTDARRFKAARLLVARNTMRAY